MKRKNLKSLENVIQIVNTFFKQEIDNGTFPTARMFEQKNLSSIYQAIRKYHGGIYTFAERLGCYVPGVFKCTDGHYVSSSYEYEVDQFLYAYGVEHEYNKPVIKENRFRYDFKISINDSTYYIEVWGYSNSDYTRNQYYLKKRKIKEKFYNVNKLNLVSIEKSIFSKSTDEIEAFLRSTLMSLGHDGNRKEVRYNVDASPRRYNALSIEKSLLEITNSIGVFPSHKTLRKLGKSSLSQAIFRFGGTNFWRSKLGFFKERQSIGYWTPSSILEEIAKISKKLDGKLPSATLLRKMGHSDLVQAMVRNGGVNYFRKMSRKPVIQNNDYSESSIVSLLHEVVLSICKFPTLNEIEKHFNNKKLNMAIWRRGGLSKFETLYDQKYNKSYHPEKKKCGRCEEYKERTKNEFYTNNRSKDGFYSVCIKCRKGSFA